MVGEVSVMAGGFSLVVGEVRVRDLAIFAVGVRVHVGVDVVGRCVLPQ